MCDCDCIGAVKAFLRELKPTLVPASFYDQVVEIGIQGDNADRDKAWAIIRQIPENNFNTLMYILTMAYKFSQVESNRMKIFAFMVVFGPNIIAREYTAILYSDSIGKSPEKTILLQN